MAAHLASAGSAPLVAPACPTLGQYQRLITRRIVRGSIPGLRAATGMYDVQLLMTYPMKKPQQHSIIAACLLPAVLTLSPTVFADDSAARYVKQADIVKPDPGHWSIPPINKQWNAPPRRDAWTIPPASRQWGRPKPAPNWTIPRTASDLLPPDE